MKTNPWSVAFLAFGLAALTLCAIKHVEMTYFTAIAGALAGFANFLKPAIEVSRDGKRERATDKPDGAA